MLEFANELYKTVKYVYITGEKIVTTKIGTLADKAASLLYSFFPFLAAEKYAATLHSGDHTTQDTPAYEDEPTPYVEAKGYESDAATVHNSDYTTQDAPAHEEAPTPYVEATGYDSEDDDFEGGDSEDDDFDYDDSKWSNSDNTVETLSAELMEVLLSANKVAKVQAEYELLSAKDKASVESFSVSDTLPDEDDYDTGEDADKDVFISRRSSLTKDDVVADDDGDAGYCSDNEEEYVSGHSGSPIMVSIQTPGNPKATIDEIILAAILESANHYRDTNTTPQEIPAEALSGNIPQWVESVC
jgi:hypothetical protein